MVQEYNGLCGAGTFGAVYHPASANVVKAIWIFSWKTSEHDSEVKAKVMLSIHTKEV